MDSGAVIALVEVGDDEQALRFSQTLAPEHLELMGPMRGALRRVTRAGCVFVGRESGTAFGDYIAGSNHTLPTSGSAPICVRAVHTPFPA